MSEASLPRNCSDLYPLSREEFRSAISSFRARNSGIFPERIFLTWDQFDQVFNRLLEKETGTPMVLPSDVDFPYYLGNFQGITLYLSNSPAARFFVL